MRPGVRLRPRAVTVVTIGLVLSSLLFSGCPSRTPAVTVVIDPIYITYLEKSGGLRFQTMDADEVFSSAEKRFMAGDFAEARRLYLMVAREEKGQEALHTAWHDAGLCSVALGDFASAEAQFSKALKSAATPADRALSQALLGRVRARLGEWGKAGVDLDEALAAGVLPPLAEAEVRVLLARASLMKGQFSEAERNLDAGQRLLIDQLTMKEQQGHALLAESYHLRGEVFRRLSDKIKLQLPQHRMELDLDDKRDLFRQAEEYYSVSVRVRNSIWSVRSGLAMGQMAEAFAGGLQAAELPEDFNSEERRVYFEQLAPFVRSILVEARDYYARTLKLANRMEFKNQWVKQCAERLDAMQARLKRPSTY